MSTFSDSLHLLIEDLKELTGAFFTYGPTKSGYICLCYLVYPGLEDYKTMQSLSICFINKDTGDIDIAVGQKPIGNIYNSVDENVLRALQENMRENLVEGTFSPSGTSVPMILNPVQIYENPARFYTKNFPSQKSLDQYLACGGDLALIPDLKWGAKCYNHFSHLSASAKDSFKSYLKSSYVYINEQLRRDPYNPGEMEKEMIKVIDSMPPSTTDCLVFRWMPRKFIEVENGVMTRKGFVSTTTTPQNHWPGSYSPDVIGILKLRVRKGTPGFYYGGHESEIIFDHLSKWRFISEYDHEYTVVGDQKFIYRTYEFESII